MYFHRLLPIVGMPLLLISACFGQSTAVKKSHPFHGKVEAINEGSKSLRVNGEKVEGWMEAMTMDYKVDDPAAFKKVKAGDQITATVYDGDPVLHKVEVIPSSSSESKSKK